MQQLPLQLEQTDYSGKKSSGFRLQRYEVLNWGTFDQQIWKLDLQGHTALLTGANGSGKSTLVDGLLTLLVPNRSRNYNLASGDTGKRERDEKSYVQGAYDRASGEDYGSKSKLLREDGTPSILLLYFLDADSTKRVSIAQVLWVQERKVKKFFVVHQDELSIQADFDGFKNVSELKKRLRGKQAEVFDNFKKYSVYFRRLLGLESDKALDLFNQTVSIKEIKSLNKFVRHHMLEKTDVQSKIQELQKNYEDLTVSHNLIEQARLQLEALHPLNTEANNHEEFAKKVAELQHNLAIAPAYFAKQKLDLLNIEITEIEQQLVQKQQDKIQSDRHNEDLRKQETDLKVAISQDSIGRRLEELKREIKQRSDEVNYKKLKAKKYDELANSLQLAVYQDRETFLATRKEGSSLSQEIDGILQRLKTQRDELIGQRPELLKQQAELQLELDSLRQRKSQIPPKNLNIRDRIANQLNIAKTDLPFVGELLKIRDDASEWSGAIERFLHSFGLNILVLEQDYRKLNSYVNNNDLKGYLSYYQVQSLSLQSVQRAFAPNKVPSKLEIKPDNTTFYQWLQHKLIQSYNYTCCDTEEQFEQHNHAITKTGLIKQDGEKHVKDDRSKIGDRRNYILGWDNAAKISAVEAELNLVNQQLDKLNKEIKSIEKKQKQRDRQQSWLQDLMNYTDFIEIDWQSSALEKQKLEKDLAELEASASRDHLKQLEFQLQEVQQHIKTNSLQRDNLIGEIKTLENNQNKAIREKSVCSRTIGEVTTKQIEEFAEININRIRRYKLNLETIDNDTEKIISKLNQEIQTEKNKQTDSKQSIMGQLLQMRNKFPEVTIEMGTSFESLPEYIKLKNKIEQDDLPKHEKKFRELIAGRVIESITMFKTSLEQKEEEIELKIDNLNKSLQEIDYTDSTYIELRYQKNSDLEIKEFRKSLKTCLGDVTKDTIEDNELRFSNIQKLIIKPFKEQTRWTNKVTDVRNWLDFSVSEYERANNTERSNYTSSSGLSGGQKSKQAFTILASAIAYQFGLHTTNFSGKSFRFVVIDEAFAKMDDEYAQYVMELFKTLNLQLLIITPRSKINVTEPYISSLHFVHNTEEKDYSSVLSISIDKFQKDRQIALSKNSDKSL